MWNFYCLMLIIYSNQFDRLGLNYSFKEIKRKINRIELFLSILIALVITIFFSTWFLILTLAIFRYECLYIQRYDESFLISYSSEWNSWETILNWAEWLRLIVIWFNIPIQIILYRQLREVMKTKLRYFYNLNRCSIQLLFASNIIYHSWIAISKGFLYYMLTEYSLYIYQRYTFLNSGTFFMIFFIKLTEGLLLCLYAVCTTSYINFQEYLKVIMHRKGVIEKFEDMTFLITKSWFSGKRPVWHSNRKQV